MCECVSVCMCVCVFVCACVCFGVCVCVLLFEFWNGFATYFKFECGRCKEEVCMVVLQKTASLGVPVGLENLKGRRGRLKKYVVKWTATSHFR